MTECILVPFDGSALAGQALEYAEELAQAGHSALILAHAVTDEDGVGHSDLGIRAGAPALFSLEAEISAEATRDAEAHGTVLADARDRLELVRLQLARHGIGATVVAEAGAARDVLTEAARTGSASLIVMATHGRSGPSRWVVGSVAETVLRRTHLPTLLLTPKILAAGGPERLRQRVVVPVDGSALSERVYPTVQRLARYLQVPVTLLRVVDPAPFYTDGALMTRVSGGAPVQQMIDNTVAGARSSLEATAKEWRASGLDVSVRVEVGQAVEAITDLVEATQVGWMAIASHGRGGFGGLVLGSTSLGLLRRSSVPVLIAARPVDEAAATLPGSGAAAGDGDGELV